MPTQNLFEKIDTLRDLTPDSINKLPQYIKDNLRVDEVRPYQERAFENFITYFENPHMLRKPSKTLFWMATGSGKTLIMAGLMLYLYRKGYRDFLFFVNNTNIIKKTIANFMDPTDGKYLFADNIIIDGRSVKIRRVSTFDESDPDSINIVFTSIQGLHSDLSLAGENKMNIGMFENRRVVLIADEAHHNNASTRRSRNRSADEEPSWENTIETVYRCDAENVLLEFTASYDYSNADIAREYADKIIYQYGLREFRNDKYSKDIEMVRTDLDVMDKVILALVFSQFRLKVFQDNHLDVKPCVLFKAHRTIKECEENIKEFTVLIKNLTGEQIRRVCESIVNEKLERVKKYFRDKGISYDALARELREGFSEEHIISANDTDVEKNQLALNSLEDKNNPYRAIFEVKKLDEGWDVLNLFDIVRMYNDRESGGQGVSPATMSEAQLIGRGARYCPFKLVTDDALYQRKYDSDIDNPLRLCETLLYHCQNDSRYIAEIHRALVETGAADDEKIECEYILKDSFKRSDLYRNGVVFVNKQVPKSLVGINSLNIKVRSKDYRLKIETGDMITSDVLDNEDIMQIDSHLHQFVVSICDIVAVNYHIVRKAVSQFKNLYFDRLKTKYPNLHSMREFITSQDYMGAIKVQIYTRQTELTLEMLYKVALYVADEINEHVGASEVTYEGTKEFWYKNIKDIFTDKKVHYESVIRDGRGEPQRYSADMGIRIDLSQEDWFAYEENYGTNEEKAFVAYFHDLVPRLRSKYDVVYLVRNERQLYIYSFNDGNRFEPDYVLFLQSINEHGKYDQLQVFIEPKGGHLLEHDKWKEDFLLQMQENDSTNCIVDNNNYLDGEYKVWGVHFYNKARNNIDESFDNDMKRLIE